MRAGRSALIRPGRELLSGQVEVDETYIGGEEAGLAGGRAKGKKALVAVAVEVKAPKGFGRCRMRVIPDGSASTLHTFITDNVATGSTVITDGWSGYLGIDKSGYPHDRRSQRADQGAGRGHRQAPTRLPGRVLLPVQPSPFTQPRTGLPASTPTRRRSRPGPLPAADQTTPATQGAATAARSDRAPAQHRPPPRDPSLATP